MLAAFRGLIDRRSDLPALRPEEFFAPGTHPWLPRAAKVCVLLLLPAREWPGDRTVLALDAAALLEERAGVMLDWAAGIRQSGAVLLFVKPWALDAKTWRRTWWRPGPEDLDALRGLAPGGREMAARKRMRLIERERGRIR